MAVDSLATVAEIVGNALVCALVTWTATQLWSVGDFFSGKPPARQSRSAFLAATLATSHLISGLMTVVVQALVLCSFRFASRPERPPALASCALALLRRTWGMFVVTAAIMAASVHLVSLAPPATRDFRVEFYVACFAGHALTTAVGMATRLVIRTQTVQGQQAAVVAVAAQQQQHQRVGVSPQTTEGTFNSSASAPQPAPAVPVSARLRRWARGYAGWLRRYARAYLQSYPSEMPVLVSGLYVHLTIYLGIPTDPVGLVVFAVGSLVLKVAAQEAAKAILTRKKVADIRTMCVAIGLPPILIDTQIRIVLQYAQSTAVAVTGILGLGVVEIAMRVAKLLWLKAQIRRHHQHFSTNSVVPVVDASSAVSSNASGSAGTAGKRKPGPDDSISTAHGSAVLSSIDEVWERQQWKLHTAELYTDMSAEYMAIGCSTLFLYYFGDHPKYLLEHTLSSLASGTSALSSQSPAESASASSRWSSHVSSSMAMQLVVEALVDLLSCVVEIYAGTDFAQLRKYRFFVVAFLANLAVANLQIAGVMYILSDS